MDRSGKIKLIVAILVIAIVVGATFVYGNIQRKKQTTDNATHNNLPTIESNQSTSQTSPQPTDKTTPSNPQQSTANKPVAGQSNTAPSSGSSSSGGASSSSIPAQPQLPTAKTPATGAADQFLPSVVLGLLTGLYIVTRRNRVKQQISLQTPKNQI